jgi:hypothetical protein
VIRIKCAGDNIFKMEETREVLQNMYNGDSHSLSNSFIGQPALNSCVTGRARPSTLKTTTSTV